MARSNNSSRYLSVASGHVDSLIDYVLDVKPYHTKLSEIVEEFLFEDHIKVKVREKHEELVVLGVDLLNKSSNGFLRVWDKIGASRPPETLSAERTIISDGVRRTFPIPITAIPKLLSHSSQDLFVVGLNENQQIVGLNHGVYSPRRFEGPGIPKILLDGVAQAESIDYHISHGAFSFNTYAGSRWKEFTVAGFSNFAQYPGALAFNNVYEQFGSIVNVEATVPEEFTLTWNGTVLTVKGSTSGNLGTCAFNQTFTSTQVTFTFVEAYGEAVGTEPFISVGDVFTLTPREKITVAPDAPQETWTLIKTNPQALSSKPVFNRTNPTAPSTPPSLSVFTQSLEWTPRSTWTITFTSATTYSISAQNSSGLLPGYPKDVELINGCTYQDELVHFTLVPPLNGFLTGDTFTFGVAINKPNYLVFGSLSGWQPPATIGKWYWNGKVGFKIPKLDYFAIKHATTISLSYDTEEWQPVVVSGQELTNISYVNQAFIASGARSIVAQSSNGLEWSSDLTNFATVGNKLLIIGEDGLVAETEDGETWLTVNTHTTTHLRGITVIPTDTAVAAATDNLVVVVGDDGTIITSLNGFGWVIRDSGTGYDLMSVTYSPDWIVAVGDNGTIIRSQDRINWIACVSPTDDLLQKVKYLNNAFWAVGKNGTIITSTDAINWSVLISNTTAELNDIAYGLNTLVAVGRGGVMCKSVDGLFWTATAGKSVNAIEFGEEEQAFVTVEHKINQIANFTPLREVHSVAAPCKYSVVFRSPINGVDVIGGTVHHNVRGYQRGFKTNQPWSDQFSSFKIGPSSDVYRPGEQIDVFLAPRSSFIAIGNYDELPYATSFYDAHVGKIEYPLDLLQEYFPLHHSQGVVIFPTINSGDDGSTIIIDKATSDSINFRIGSPGDGLTVPGELAAVKGWIPLEYRYSDRRISNDSTAEFPDLATYIDAYLASDPDTKVFSINQPRYKTTNRPASATLTFEEAFFTKYVPERRYFSLRFNQADSYGQTINVKMTENMRVYARIRLNFDEIAMIDIIDDAPTSWETITFLNTADEFSVAFAEGGMFSNIGYSDLPYDAIGYDISFSATPVQGVLEVPPGSHNYIYTGDPGDFATIGTATQTPAITVRDTTIEAAGTSFAEGLQIIVRHTAQAVVGYDQYAYDVVPYDYTDDIPVGTILTVSLNYVADSSEGLYVTDEALEYVVTHDLPSTPTVLIQPDTGAPFTVEPTLIYTPVSGATLSSFKFSVPNGTGPFTLTLS